MPVLLVLCAAVDIVGIVACFDKPLKSGGPPIDASEDRQSSTNR